MSSETVVPGQRRNLTCPVSLYGLVLVPTWNPGPWVLQSSSGFCRAMCRRRWTSHDQELRRWFLYFSHRRVRVTEKAIRNTFNVFVWYHECMLFFENILKLWLLSPCPHLLCSMSQCRGHRRSSFSVRRSSPSHRRRSGYRWGRPPRGGKCW